MGDAIQGSDMLKGLVLFENLVLPHELVEAEPNERSGYSEWKFVYAVVGIIIMRRCKL